MSQAATSKKRAHSETAQSSEAKHQQHQQHQQYKRHKVQHKTHKTHHHVNSIFTLHSDVSEAIYSSGGSWCPDVARITNEYIGDVDHIFTCRFLQRCKEMGVIGENILAALRKSDGAVLMAGSFVLQIVFDETYPGSDVDFFAAGRFCRVSEHYNIGWHAKSAMTVFRQTLCYNYMNFQGHDGPVNTPVDEYRKRLSSNKWYNRSGVIDQDKWAVAPILSWDSTRATLTPKKQPITLRQDKWAILNHEPAEPLNQYRKKDPHWDWHNAHVRKHNQVWSYAANRFDDKDIPLPVAMLWNFIVLNTLVGTSTEALPISRLINDTFDLSFCKMTFDGYKVSLPFDTTDAALSLGKRGVLRNSAHNDPSRRAKYSKRGFSIHCEDILGTREKSNT